MSWSGDEPEPRGNKSPGVRKGTVGSWDCMMQPQPFGGLQLTVQFTHLTLCEALGTSQALPLESNFTDPPESLGL